MSSKRGKELYGAIKEKLGYASPFEAAYWTASKQQSVIALAVFVGVPLVGGFIIAMLCQKDVLSWYGKKVKKPSWCPPNWAFGPTWSVLYILMGIAAWMVWSKGGWTPNKFSLSAFAVQLLLNWAWNPTFFLAKKLDLALIDIIALLGALTTTAVAFHHVEPKAGLLFIPYFAVVSFATALNYTLLELNPKYATKYIRVPHLPGGKQA